MLLAFFFTSSKLTKVGEDRKRKVDPEFKEGGQRNWCVAFYPLLWLSVSYQLMICAVVLIRVSIISLILSYTFHIQCFITCSEVR